MNINSLSGFSCVVAVVTCLGCRSTDEAATLHIAYPDLLRQAAIGGFYRFRVGLDSAGAPNLGEFQVLSSPNPGFDLAVKRALAPWRPRAPTGTQRVEHTILFVVLPPGADSARACPPQRGYTLVCGLLRTMHADSIPPVVSH
jgi:hypothetical protein